MAVALLFCRRTETMQAEAANATSRSSIVAALQNAAQATGADFHYLLGTATRESGLDPSVKADTSSATGLFQFIDQSWLAVVKNYGPKHGLASFANAITRGTDGRYSTANSSDRQAILALRTNPQVAALMEGEYAQASRATLAGSLGRDISGGELYCAHFLGDNAACRLIRMSENQPLSPAADAFPAAAQANRRLFYHSDGTPKTAREVYDWATKQPNATQLSGAPAKPTKAIANAPVVMASSDDDSGLNALMASMTSWSPRHGFFSSDEDENSTTPSTPFLMTPGVMDVLSAIH
jgi:hypothetical protein